MALNFLNDGYFAGKVGIGTISPQGILDVRSDASNSVPKIIVGNSTTTYNQANSGSIVFTEGGTYEHMEITYNGASNKLLFNSPVDSATGLLTINRTGNVGIGTTSPDFKLDVAGDVRIENLHGLYFGGDTSTTFKWGMASSGADLVINNNNTNGDVTFINDGNVGIGTTSPDALLHVRAATNVTGTIEVQGGKATVTSAGEINSELNFGSNDASATGGIGGSIKSVTEATNGAYVGMSFYTTKQGRTPVLEEAMRIDHDGNVGIGTANPQSTRKLDVVGHIQGSQNLYLGVAGTNLSSNSIEIGQGRTGNGFAYMDLTGDATYTDYGLRIIRDNTGANASSQIVHRGTGDFSITTTEGADILLIPNSGNVGIGTTSPDTLLQTTNTADGTDYISYEIGNTAVNASNKGGFAIYELGTKKVTLEYYRDGSAITNLSTPHSFTIDTNSQERMQISNAGAIKFNNYGAGTLVTDASGNITAATSGPGTGTVTGTGTDNTIPLWNGTTGLDNSAITQTAVGAISIHETNPLNAVDFNIKAIAHYCSMRMKGAAGSGADISFYDNLTYLAGIVGVPGGELHFNTSTNIATNGLALSLNNVQEARFHSSGIDGTMKNPILFGASGGASGSGIGQENRIRSSVSQTRANNILKFETATNTVGTFNENQLVLDGMGNVGIGTTSPNQKLHVNGATQLGDISSTVNFGTVALKVVEGTVSTGPTLGSGTVGAQAVLYSNGQFGMYTGVSTNGDTWMQSQRNDTGTSTYDILLNPAGGNIGIGTTTPTHKLDVAGDIRLQSDNQIYFGATGSIPYWTAGVDNTTNNNFVIGGASYYTGDRDILLNPVNNGNVGIKTTSPSYELDVVGDIRARGNGTGNIYVGTYGARLSNYYSSITTNAEFRVGYAGGTYAICRASAFTVTSDYRLKEKIVPLTDSLDRLGQLNVYKFNWIDKPNEEPVDGFIAHEVAEVIPEAVVGVKDEIGPDGKPEYQGLDQAKIVPLLTAALQESITKIEQLEQRIQTLENK